MAQITPLSAFPARNDSGQVTITAPKVQLIVANSGTVAKQLLLVRKGDGGYYNIVSIVNAEPSPDGKGTETLVDNYESAEYSVVQPNGTTTGLDVYLDSITAASQPLPSDAATETTLAAISAQLAASLPLPSGAATAAKQPALGTAGSASADVLSVQGVAGGTAVQTSVSGLLVAQGSTTSGQTGPLLQGAVTTAAPSYTTAQTSPLSLTTGGALRVNSAQLPSALGATTRAGSISVTIATDQGSGAAALKVTPVGGTGAQRAPNANASMPAGVSFQRFNANGTNTIVNGTTVLYGITVSTAGVGSTLTVYDSASASGTVLGVFDTTKTGSFWSGFAVYCPTGITIVAAGGTPADFFVTYAVGLGS